jgi:hypothetical protein
MAQTLWTEQTGGYETTVWVDKGIQAQILNTLSNTAHDYSVAYGVRGRSIILSGDGQKVECQQSGRGYHCLACGTTICVHARAAHAVRSFVMDRTLRYGARFEPKPAPLAAYAGVRPY